MAHAPRSDDGAPSGDGPSAVPAHVDEFTKCESVPLPGSSRVVALRAMRLGITGEAGPRLDHEYAMAAALEVLDAYVDLSAFCQEVVLAHEPEERAQGDAASDAFECNPLLGELLYLLDDCLRDAREALARVRLQLDAHARQPVRLGPYVSSNAHAAIVGLGQRALEAAAAHGIRIPADPGGTIEIVSRPTDKARASILKFIDHVSKGPHVDGAELQMFVRMEAASAISAANRSVPSPALPPDTTASAANGGAMADTRKMHSAERQMLDTLRNHRTYMKGVALMHAAGLNPDSGSYRSLLASLVKRRWLTNYRGYGYGLPEWAPPTDE
jgi:hypothetical protein